MVFHWFAMAFDIGLPCFFHGLRGAGGAGRARRAGPALRGNARLAAGHRPGHHGEREARAAGAEHRGPAFRPVERPF